MTPSSLALLRAHIVALRRYSVSGESAAADAIEEMLAECEALRVCVWWRVKDKRSESWIRKV